MSSKINPFGKVQTERSPVDILQETFGIGIKDYDRGADQWDAEEGKWSWVPNITQECVVEFSVNEGKGTGRQTIPANEFREYVDVLQSIMDSGFREEAGADRTAYVPTHVIASQSFKMVSRDNSGDRNLVSVRCTGGKGAKPMMIPRDQFGAVVAMLTKISESLDEYEDQAWSNLKGE